VSLPAEYFAERWGDSDDPWQIAVRWYERRKRDVLMACLPASGTAAASSPAARQGISPPGWQRAAAPGGTVVACH
jgi:hypothetical protein